MKFRSSEVASGAQKFGSWMISKPLRVLQCSGTVRIINFFCYRLLKGATSVYLVVHMIIIMRTRSLLIIRGMDRVWLAIPDILHMLLHHNIALPPPMCYMKQTVYVSPLTKVSCRYYDKVANQDSYIMCISLELIQQKISSVLLLEKQF